MLRQPPANAPGLEGLKAQAAAWRVEGYGSRGPDTTVAPKRLLKSVYLADGALAKRNELLMEKYTSMKAEAKALCTDTDDAELVIVAFGSIGRIAQSAQRSLRAQGHKVGIVRPLTLYPFPDTTLEALAAQGKRFLVIEQNTGQMVEDVRLAIRKHGDAQWHGIMPGLFIGADTLMQPIVNALKGA